MITKITSENKNQYKVLFEKASNVLQLSGNDTIDSLDKYFSVLRTLVIGQEDPSYAFLPLDEPTFDINADTRVITIPSEFRKNGISVKGDHYAETLYFTINRYFDATDLYDDNIKIIIQWEDPSGQKGVSLAVFKDVKVLAHENKMLFGWALTNNITDAHGNVKFSVRFYEVDGNGDLSYSLSTLTASAVINPGLDYQFSNGQLVDDIPLFADDAEHLKERLRDSAYVDPTDIPEEASWVINLPDPDNEILYKYDLDENNECSLTVEAESTQGVITYEWKWIPTDDVDARAPIGTIGDVYVQTQDPSYSGEKVYYHKVTRDNVEAYETFGFTADTLIPNGENDPIVYEKKYGLTVSHHDDSSPDITGEYYAIAYNRIGLGSSQVESNHIIIPGPDTLEVLSPTEEINHAYLNNEGKVTLTARATTGTDGDTITYTCGEVYVEGDSEETLINTNSSTKARNVEAEFLLPFDNTVSAAERATFDKIYAVEIIANRNGRHTNPPEIFKYRVTDLAHEPIVQLSQVNKYANTENPSYLTATVTNADEIAHDEFIYEWYLYNPSDNSNPDPEVFAIEGDTYLGTGTITANAEYNFSTFEATAQGRYYCKVKTRVNGSDSTYWAPTQDTQLLVVSGL